MTFKNNKLNKLKATLDLLKLVNIVAITLLITDSFMQLLFWFITKNVWCLWNFHCWVFAFVITLYVSNIILIIFGKHLLPGFEMIVELIIFFFGLYSALMAVSPIIILLDIFFSPGLVY